MELTRRQELAIRKLVDLYLEYKEPLHYSVLAKRLGISRFSAYDMLRLLEEKGYVASDYYLDKNKGGPGRAEVVFMPTEKAHNEFQKLNVTAESESLGNIKDQFLRIMRVGGFKEKELLEEMLARFPDESGPLGYCVEVITIIALRLKHGAGRRLLLDYLPIILPQVDSSKMDNLILLGGFALGVLVVENSNDREWCVQLFEHVRRYQTMVAKLSSEQQKRLSLVLNELFATFQKDAPDDSSN